MKIAMFENGKPEELLALMKKFNTTIDRTGAIYVSGRIKYLHTMLHGGSLQEFDDLEIQNSGTKNPHLKSIQEVLLGH